MMGILKRIRGVIIAGRILITTVVMTFYINQSDVLTLR